MGILTTLDRVFSTRRGTLFVLTRHYEFVTDSFDYLKNRRANMNEVVNVALVLQKFAGVFPDTAYELVVTEHVSDLSSVYLLPCEFPSAPSAPSQQPDRVVGRKQTSSLLSLGATASSVIEGFVGVDCADLIGQYVEDARMGPAMVLCPFERHLDRFLRANNCDQRFVAL